MTVKRSDSEARSGSSRKQTYIVCLDCGQEFPFNWEELRVEPRIPTTAPQRVPDAFQPMPARPVSRKLAGFWIAKLRSPRGLLPGKQ